MLALLNKILVNILFVLGIVSELFAFEFSFKHGLLQNTFIVWISFHLLASLFVSLGLLCLYYKQGKYLAINWFVYSFCVTCSVPLWGFLGSLFVGCIYYIFSNFSDDRYEEFKDFISYEKIGDVALDANENYEITLKDRLDIEPIIDILRGDDMALKKKAITRLEKTKE